MKAMFVVGLGFGDEGKGATIDYLSRKLNPKLVVRFNGGCQAGHNVQLPDGRHHTFSQFGSGTLAGVPTYLDSHMVIDPITMLAEAIHLNYEFGIDAFNLLTVHPSCLVVTPYHIAMNRIRETLRTNRHGSCGAGVGEARQYWLKYGFDALTAGDLQNKSAAIEKLELLRQRIQTEWYDLCSAADRRTLIKTGVLDSINGLLNNRSHRQYLKDCPKLHTSHIDQAIWSSNLITQQKTNDCILFEGAQGILLDERYGFYPHTSWGASAPESYQCELEAETMITLGVTRTYHTRHGEGPLPTYCPELTSKLIDIYNPTNDWQGSLRCGYLDRTLLDYAISVANVDGLVVNHCDQKPERQSISWSSTFEWSNAGGDTLDEFREFPTRDHDDILNKVSPVYRTFAHPEDLGGVVITGHGPTFQDRKLLKFDLFGFATK